MLHLHPEENSDEHFVLKKTRWGALKANSNHKTRVFILKACLKNAIQHFPISYKSALPPKTSYFEN